ncbi:MAG: aquaporin [Actinomycetota bacterium]|nr:aquaporin [Actinomycetota bacterium]
MGSDSARVDGRDGERETPLARQLFAESLGTGFLTFIAAGAQIDAVLSHGRVDLVAKAFAPGLLVMALIYAMGDVSGAHFNPAVTLAFTLRRVFPARLLPLYWAAQVVGALGAAGLLRAMFGTTEHLGSSRLHISAGRGFVFEIVLTWLLITVILSTATRHRVIGPEAAIAVGGTIALCGLVAEPLTGASMNPARSLGPALVSGTYHDLWIYLGAPLAGAVVATLTARLLHPHRNQGEVEAAGGEQSQQP